MGRNKQSREIPPDRLLQEAKQAIKQRDWATAAAYFQRLLGRLRRAPATVRDQFLLNALTGYCRCLMAMGQAPRALSFARRALRLAPDKTQVQELYLNVLEALGRWRRALKLANQWLRAKPRDLQLRLTVARLHARLKESGEAFAHLLVALDIAPNHPGPYRLLAQILNEEGMPRRAIAVLRRGVSQAPNDPSLWIMLGYLLRGQGQFREALQYLQRGLELGNDSAELRELMAQICVELGLMEQAEEHLRKGLEKAPNHLGLLDSLAFIYIQQERFQDALPLILRALRIAPMDPLLQFKLAAVYQQLGKFADAAQAFRKVIALAPGTDLAEDAQELLDLMDSQQLEQVITLCMEDPVFRISLMRDPKGTLEARGFALSEASMEIVVNMDISRLPKRWGSPQGHVS
ncbi:TPR repeat-containing protein YrrB [bacterium HR17]|uniref:TPR repeat-containing protein YrrB n=1 Tax=Candidatus Fervidibacter japonicus TaxID=2035412 RepID=A0A2H5XC57_9BACT|nr:TPR repeat-containing protein YrrB [bacterium HR17]